MNRWHKFLKVFLAFMMLIIHLNVCSISVAAEDEVAYSEESVTDLEPELDVDTEIEVNDEAYDESDDEIIDDDYTELLELDEHEEIYQMPVPFNASIGDGLIQFELHPVGTLPNGVSEAQARTALMNVSTVTHPLFANATTTLAATAVNGAFGRDALFLGTSANGNRYRILIAGFEGYVNRIGATTHTVTVAINGQNHQLTVRANAVFVPFGHDGTARHLSPMIETNLPELLFSYQTLEYTPEGFEVENRIGILAHQLPTAQSVSHYINRNGELWRVLTNNVNTSTGGAQFLTGPAPSWMSQNTKYYSFDGVYFYRNPRNIRVNGTGAVNANNPHFNYFQYLSFRSASSVTASQLNNFLHHELGTAENRNNSVLTGQGQHFINAQNRYGVNALLQYSKAMLESGRGLSAIARNNNNVFGLNAIDSAPGQNASVFPTVAASINDHANGWMSRGYLWPEDWRYEGPHSGHKGSGMNVRYATDPYWGQKIAGWAFRIDRTLNHQDRNREQIVIKQNRLPIAVINAGDTTLYMANPRQNRYFPFLVRGRYGNRLRIVTDASIVNGVANRTALFNRSTSIGYIPNSNVWQAGADTPATDTSAHHVTVEGGRVTGGGTHLTGQSVSIRANIPRAGYRFDRWTTTTPGVTFRNARDAATTFTMPSRSVTVRAVFVRRVAPSPAINVRRSAITRNNHVALHRGPGTAYHLSRHLVQGRPITILNNGRNGWRFVQVGTGNIRGWIRSSQMIQMTSLGIVTDTRVPMRAGVNSGATLNHLNRNANITILGTNANRSWTQVRTSNQTGWVRTNQIRTIVQPGRTRYRTAFRRGPGTGFGTIRTLRNNTSFQVLGRRGNWLRVRIGNQTGWIGRSAARSIPAARTRHQAHLRQGPGNSFARTSSNSIGRNARVTVLARQGGWSRIRVGNRTGWVRTNQLR